MKNILSSFLLTVSLSSLTIAQTTTSLPADFPLPEKYYPELKTVLEDAQELAPEIITEKFRQQEFDEDLRIARSSYWPRINAGGNFGFNYQYITDSGESSQNQGGSFNVNASRPIYQWGALNARVKVGEYNYRNNSRNVITNYQAIVNSIRSNYLQLTLNKIKEAKLALEEQIAESTLQEAKSDFQSGNLSRQDYQTSLNEYKKSVLAIDQLNFEQEQITESFLRLSGAKQTIRPATFLPEVNTGSLTSWLNTRANNPHDKWFLQHRDILNQQDLIAREDSNYIIARARQLPNFNFSTSVNQGFTNTATNNNVPVINFFAGVNAGWNLFDGFATQATKNKVRILQDRLELGLVELKLDLLQEEYDLRKQLQFDFRSLEIEESLLELSQEQLEISKKDFKQSLISKTDLNNEKLDFSEVEIETLSKRVEVIENLLSYIALIQQDPITQNLSLTEEL